MIQPVSTDERLQAQIEATAAEVSPDALVIWWFGQSGFLVQCQGKRILFDPYLSDSLTRKYEATDKPHVRMSARVIRPELLTGIDVVTSSHNHTDHLDAETLNPILAGNPGISLLIPEANRDFVCSRLDLPLDFPKGLSEGETIGVGGARFAGIASAHNEIERDELGRPMYMGFVLHIGKWRLYHSGDTLVYPGLADVLRPHAVDVAFLPINGNRPERRVAGNMNGREAAELASAINAGLVIPHHYHLFEFNTEEPEEFGTACQRLGQPYRIMQLGERLILEA